jgi:predicted esterase
LACLLIAVGVISVAGLVSCGNAAVSTRNSLPPRASLPLPLRVEASVHGAFVTRRLTVPKGYGSAGRPFYVDERRSGGVAEPLVLLLPGLDQSPARVEHATAATAFSDAAHFTLVYPIGEKEAWNAGDCCRRDSANDVGYLVDLVHYVATLTPVDLHHVYIWGFSNGGMMAWRAICQTRNIFAGAGVMSGALLVNCPTPVHVVDVHGLNDATVPYEGGYSHYTHTVMPDSATERSRLVAGSTLDVVLLTHLGHEWPPLHPGSFDALNAFWQRLRGYGVAHPATETVPIEAPAARAIGGTREG